MTEEHNVCLVFCIVALVATKCRLPDNFISYKNIIASLLAIYFVSQLQSFKLKSVPQRI